MTTANALMNEHVNSDDTLDDLIAHCEAAAVRSTETRLHLPSRCAARYEFPDGSILIVGEDGSATDQDPICA